MAKLWTTNGEYLGSRARRGFVASVPEAEFSFESQRCQYPDRGQPGINYFRGDFDDGPFVGKHVDVLLHRDADGWVTGILFHYPFDMPPWEHKGGVNIFVSPERGRQGVAAALLRVGGPRFNLNLVQQNYTPAGAAFINRFLGLSR